MDMRRRGFTKSLALGVIVLILMTYGIYYAMQSPFGSPSESNRVKHPAGFSVVVPANWETKLISADPGKGLGEVIYSIPIKATGRPGSFLISRQLAPPDLTKLTADGYEPSERLGFPAYRKLWDGNYVRHLNYYFEKEGRWYTVELDRNKTEPVDSWWQPFIKTFRVDAPSPAPSLTTQP